MKIGDIQADRVFPITEELQNELHQREQRRQMHHRSRENDWTKTGPLAKYWSLPLPLCIPALSVVLTVLLVQFMSAIIWETSKGKSGKSMENRLLGRMLLQMIREDSENTPEESGENRL